LTGGEQKTLAEIGIDSLTLAVLLVDLEHLLQPHDSAERADGVDGRFSATTDHCRASRRSSKNSSQPFTPAFLPVRSVLQRITAQQDRV